MKTLYSSAFVSMVLGFLMVMGYNNQPVEIVRTQTPPDFVTIFEPKEPMVTDKIKVEVFDDLVCKHCDTFFSETLPKIRDLEKESGEVELHLYFIPNINDELLSQAAMALKCAADQNQYWGVYDLLHKNVATLDSKNFGEWATDLKMDPKVLKACMDGKKFQSEIESDIRYASEKMVSTKPTVIINNYRLVGAQPFENIQKVIRQIIRDREQSLAEIQLSEAPTDLQGELQKAFQLPQELGTKN
jgi:protein-disulfide isomerase